MKSWNMLTLVGGDRAGIVAKVSEVLYQKGWNLGEASMIRLGGNFSIMMMVHGEGDLFAELKPLAHDLKLRIHVDPIDGKLHQHLVPNIQVRVAGADRAGIVAQITGTLAEKGFNILELECDVAGSDENPVYIMNIQGFSNVPVETLQKELEPFVEQGIGVDVSAVEMMLG